MVLEINQTVIQTVDVIRPGTPVTIEILQGLKGDPGDAGTGVSSWNDLTDKPATFAPSAHTHGIIDVSGLQTALDLKAPLASPAFTGTPTGITKTHVGLANVDNTSDANKPVSTAQQTALNLKANLASPTFTGTVVVPDASFTIAKTSGLQAALDGKTATGHTHVSANITDLTTTVQGIVNTQLDIAGSPATLDTINELAAALGDDANFATTVTNSLALKAPLASPTFTGTVVVPDSSWTIAKTSGLQAALDAKAASAHTHTAADISDSTTTGRAVVVAASQAAARTAIGAGTSNLVIGTAGTDAKAGNYAPTVADIPAGSTLVAQKSGGVWPARPTARADVVVIWKGADPSPSIVSSGTGGMHDNIDVRFVE